MLTTSVFAFFLFQSLPATIAGQVSGGTPTRPISGAVVRAGTRTVVTDQNGRFTIDVDRPVPPATTLRLIVSATGFIETAVDVRPDTGTLDIVLQSSEQVREEVVVSASSEQAVPPPTLPVAPAEVNAVAGALDNVFRVLQTLPGVSATDDFGSRLSVRGGGPDQNLTVMDGVEIHNPYRLFGLTSAFNPDTIDRFELTAGGFGAQYGDRLSSILVVDNRRGSRARALQGSAALSVTDANVVMEGRLPGRANGSWLLTGRRTYYDVFAERVTDEDLPSFGDLQTKLSWSSARGRELTIFGLRSREKTDAAFSADAPGDTIALKNDSANDVASVTFVSALGARATSKTVASWYRFGDTLDVDASLRDESRRSNTPGNDAYARALVVFRRVVAVRDVSLRQHVSVRASSRHTIETGLEAHLLRTEWGSRITGDRNLDEPNGSSALGGTGLPDVLDSFADTARAAVWIEDDVNAGAHVRMAGGLRVDWNGISSETIPQPRLRTEITIGPRTILRAATGLYTQSPGYEKLLQSDYFVDLTNAGTLGIKSERSRHAVIGVEQQIGRATTLRVEGYYKTFDRLLVGRLETADETGGRVAEYAFPPELASNVPTAPQITSVPSNSASGHAYGFDVYLQKRSAGPGDPVSGWLSYTWGRAFVDSYGRAYPFDYDRRHALSLVSTLRVTRRFDVATTLRLASGFPETIPVGVRVGSELAEGATPHAPGSLVPARDDAGRLAWSIDNGTVADLNNGRLPIFARLDLRVTYTSPRASHWQLYVELINALNRDNAGALRSSLKYDVTSDRPRLDFNRDEGLPLLPSFGLRLHF